MQTVLGEVAEIWRYPVSGLQGESLASVQMTVHGLAGDHVYALRSKETGRILDPKAYQFSWGKSVGAPGMLKLRSELRGDPSAEHSVDITGPDGHIPSTKASDIDAALSVTLSHHSSS